MPENNNGAGGLRDRIELHDRQFQKYSWDNKVYCLPIDGEEEDRLVLQHNILQHVFDGRLHFTPQEYPSRVLDCGYGNGEWVKAFASTYPESEVTGLDIWPSDTAEYLDCDNLYLELCDFNDRDWLRGSQSRNYYELINSRHIMAGIKEHRWQSYLEDLVGLLKRGGWLQMVEYDYEVKGSIQEGTYLHRWNEEYGESMKALNRNPGIGRRLAGRMRRAGLVDVQTQMYPIPIGAYHADAKWRQIGEMNLQNFESMLESHSIWPLTQPLQRRGAYTQEAIDALVEGAKAEASNTNLQLHIPLYVAWGKKP